MKHSNVAILDIYRISDSLYDDWFALSEVKIAGEKAENEIAVVKQVIENNNSTLAVGLAHWDKVISSLESQKKSWEEKLASINTEIGDAQVNTRICSYVPVMSTIVDQKKNHSDFLIFFLLYLSSFFFFISMAD